MAIAILELDKAVRAVAPIDGVAVGDPADKKTWRIDFMPTATKTQMAAAQSVVDGFIYQDVPEPDPIADLKIRMAAVEAKVDTIAPAAQVATPG